MTDEEVLARDDLLLEALEAAGLPQDYLAHAKKSPSKRNLVLSFARWIGEHYRPEPPVEPELLFVQKALAKQYPWDASQYLSGKLDSLRVVQASLACVKAWKAEHDQ